MRWWPNVNSAPYAPRALSPRPHLPPTVGMPAPEIRLFTACAHAGEMKIIKGKSGYEGVDALPCPGRISGALPLTINYPWHTCAKTCSCYTCNCCFRAGWNSPLVVNRAVPKGRRGADEVSVTEPMSPRPVRVLVRMPAELVRFQYQRLESG